MKIILTHEQADFDAIAALLAAYLIYEPAVPVLPRKMNRNVRSFLALYGEELPFIDVRDIPAEEIENILLVDTQALVTLKGASKHIKVQVIDHHQVKENIDKNWIVNYEQVGAVTTVLTEAIQEHNIPLNTTQATLLLLGIYEDTGSLSYASTTARDIRSAAYLLEQGANLKIAVNYLNPPLSPEQRMIYDRLVASAQVHSINGLRIVISTAEGQDLQEEISSIAHKMRDLLEPDGLIIIVATEEGYRLVLRSTNDLINVATIANHFGGGGHERAAAALIRRPPGAGHAKDNEELLNIAAELLRAIPGYIRPSVSVRQIMSRRPRLISPTLSVGEASRLMQRYGYEGFPVVDDGTVVGLLTRRIVDRAMAHKLNLKASSLMEAGNVTVSPLDSIEHLQDVMTESGWGQVPVFDPEKKDIVGIVTRTDLLKTLSAQSPRQRSHHLAGNLEGALPRERLLLLKAVADQASHQHMAAYVVGGFVRDIIIGRPGADFDIVVEGDAIHLAGTLVDKFGGRMVSHSRFGTAKWYLDRTCKELTDLIPPLKDNPVNHKDFPNHLDLITARTEFYEHPTALPTIERSSIKLDLHRRDFTINTMAIRLDGRHYGELLDHWGGYNDLKKGIIRVLHSLSFIDDPTRALRAVRFEQRFNFKIEQRTQDLMIEAAGQLKAITGERIRHEFDLILAEEKAAQMLQRLSDLNLLSSIHTGLICAGENSEQLTRLLNTPPPPKWGLPERMWGYPMRRVLGYTFWLMDLPRDVIQSVTHRLRIPGTIVKVILDANMMKDGIEGLVGKSPSEISTYLADKNAAAILCVYQYLQSPEQQSILEQYQTTWRKMEPSIDGTDLSAIGLKPGPHFKVILTELKGAWLDGKIRSKSEEQGYLSTLIKKFSL